MRQKSTLATSTPARRAAGFTLIEILAVIAIISIIAALVVGLAPGVARKKRLALVEADKEKLILLIENYQSKLGHYPPDNGFLTNNATYDLTSSSNQLFYELSGAIFDTNNSPNFFIGTNTVSASDLTSLFNVGGIANSAPTNSSEPPKNFFPDIRPNQFRPYYQSQNGNVVLGLVVPVDLNGNFTNFWHYDASTTNRHNPDTYDLWAVFSVGSQIVTNGNWKQ